MRNIFLVIVTFFSFSVLADTTQVMCTNDDIGYKFDFDSTNYKITRFDSYELQTINKYSFDNKIDSTLIKPQYLTKLKEIAKDAKSAKVFASKTDSAIYGVVETSAEQRLYKLENFSEMFTLVASSKNCGKPVSIKATYSCAEDGNDVEFSLSLASNGKFVYTNPKTNEKSYFVETDSTVDWSDDLFSLIISEEYENGLLGTYVNFPSDFSWTDSTIDLHVTKAEVFSGIVENEYDVTCLKK